MKSLFSILAALTLLVGSAFAQAKPACTNPTTLETVFAPYAVGAITNAPGAGNQNYIIGAGVEHDGGKVYLDANGVYSSEATTSNPGQGHNGLLEVQGYYKFFGHILGGGGATAVLNTGEIKTKGIINTAKAQANPFVGAGLEFGRLRSIASYQIPVRGEGVPEQIKFNLNSEFAFTRHLRLYVPLVISSYQTAPLKSLGGARVTIAQAGAGIKLVF